MSQLVGSLGRQFLLSGSLIESGHCLFFEVRDNVVCWALQFGEPAPHSNRATRLLDWADTVTCPRAPSQQAGSSALSLTGRPVASSPRALGLAGTPVIADQ